MESFSVTMLGTASAMPVATRNQSAQVLCVHGRFFLIDAGEGLQRQMVRCHLPLGRIEAVMISHIHGDHIFGLPGFLSTLGMTGRTTPLTIFAPPSFGPVLKFFLSYWGEGLRFEIRFVPLKMKAPERILSSKSFFVEAFPLNHGIETFGFRFAEKEPMMNVRKEAIGRYGLTLTEIGTLKAGGDVVREDCVIPNGDAAYKPFEPRSYAYCSDTAPFPEEAEWLRGTTVIYHEATYIDALRDEAERRHHTTTLQAATLAREAGARKLIIGHYSSRGTPPEDYEAQCREIFPQTYAASDGDVYEIG